MSESTTVVRARVPVRRLKRYVGAIASLRPRATARQVSASEREPDLLGSALHAITPEEEVLVKAAAK